LFVSIITIIIIFIIIIIIIVITVIVIITIIDIEYLLHSYVLYFVGQYIRGGDFFVRQAAGEHPKQLNYSRAFGGKDLKMFGLSVEPDISHFELSEEDRLVLLGSDGLWDVLNPRLACEIAMKARKENRSASQDIVKWAIEEMPNVGVRDNITVIALFLNEGLPVSNNPGTATSSSSSSSSNIIVCSTTIGSGNNATVVAAATSISPP
jgi:hypothetical protein